jgi:hypothetical protein
MGLEAETKALIEGVERAGTLQLESDFLLFRAPDYRWKIPLATLKAARVEAGALEVKLERGGAVFALGDAVAAKWLDKIQNPKSLLDKLGVKADHAVGILGLTDESFLELLRSRLHNPPLSRLKQNLDVVLAGLSSADHLDRIAKARQAIHAKGMIWLIYAKGGKTITEQAVRAATASLGLVDVKVVSFSSTHTAVKVVIPVAARKGAK